MAATTGSADLGAPPLFLRLVGHPIRWRLLAELARSDRAVKELIALVDEPQSLVSYHLRELRHGELVTAHRSSADRRDSYYAIDLARCDALLHASGAALHPGLGTAPTPPTVAATSGRGRPLQVLFLCTGNGTRSQLAEALLQATAGRLVEAASAGTKPKPVHPNAIRVLRERGIDISDRRSKHVDQFARRRFDIVITLCDRVREVCPELPGKPDAVHWSIPDPGLEGDSDDATYPAFERTARALETRIRFLLADIQNRPHRRSRAHA